MPVVTSNGLFLSWVPLSVLMAVLETVSPSQSLRVDHCDNFVMVQSWHDIFRIARSAQLSPMKSPNPKDFRHLSAMDLFTGYSSSNSSQSTSSLISELVCAATAKLSLNLSSQTHLLLRAWLESQIRCSSATIITLFKPTPYFFQANLFFFFWKPTSL